MMSSVILDIAATVVALIFSFFWYARRNKAAHGYLPLPPSPRGWLPLIGHLLEVPVEDGYKAYHSMCQQLETNILYFNMAGQHVIVLDTYEECLELLEKRSSLYSSRPLSTMVCELMGFNFSFILMKYGNIWRDRRRIMHDSFHPSAAKSFRPVQLKSARALLSNLTANTDVLQELRQMAGDTIITIAYGLDVKPRNDPYIQIAEEAVRTSAEAAVPGAFWVDALPILKYLPAWMPGASFQRKARGWKTITERMVSEPYNAFLDTMKEGVAKPSFCCNGLQTVSAKGGIYTEENVRDVAGTLFQAGADTAVSILGFCILSLLDRPDIARKIQDEIDLVTESSRLPDFEDEDSLPYLKAFVKEAMRYWAVVPISFPHFLEVEDEYKGYRVPAQSMILPNTWAILHNEAVFPDPFSIKPERFLSGDNLKIINAHYNSTWGYGRRVCPGRYMGFASLWITLAHILAVYDISKAKDDDGNVVEPSHEPVATSILLMPQEYVCSFTFRSLAAQELVELVGEVA